MFLNVLLHYSVCLLLYFHQIFAQGEYTAAVVEHAPIKNAIPSITIENNLKEYNVMIQSAKIYEPDIIVFPEYGLTTLLNDDDDLDAYAVEIPNNGTNSNKVLEILRGLAKNNSIYVVVNLLEKEVTFQKKIKYYNTNLAYNRKGEIIAKYRKINLFNEDRLTPGDLIKTFTTDFGVTFGMFICNDIYYQYPAIDILRFNQHVTDIVFSTAWFSTLPFAASLSVQSGYATSNRVNLLASNYNDPKQSHGGSGIYQTADTKTTIYISGTHSTKLTVNKVKKIKSRDPDSICSPDIMQTYSKSWSELIRSPRQLRSDEYLSNYITLKDFDTSMYTIKDARFTQDQSIFKETLCQDDFCCNFSIHVLSASEKDHFKLVMFNEHILRSDMNHRFHFCALLACADDDASTCGDRVPVYTQFGTMSVTSNYTNATFQWPLTLTTTLEPIENLLYCKFSKDTASPNNTFVSTQNIQQKNVWVFGIFGSTDDGSLCSNIGILAKIMVFVVFLQILF